MASRPSAPSLEIWPVCRVRHIRHYRLGKEKIHMIYDKRAELARYFGLSPNLDAAIRFLQTTDLSALPMGRTEIPGGDICYNHFT